MNGAEMYDGIMDKEEHFYVMKKEWIQQCHERLASFPSDPYVVRNGVLYAKDNSSFTSASQKYLKDADRPVIVKEDSEFWAEDATKTGFRVSEEVMSAIEEHLKQFTFKEYIGFKTETTMYEFGHAKANKGDLLKKFCERYQIPLESVWAFGDMTNDISLLEASGVGVCMCNGSEDAKAVSDYISDLPVEEDGWADYIEKYILV